MRGDTEHVLGGHVVADGAFGPAGEVPGLPPDATGNAWVGDQERAVTSLRFHQQLGIGLFVVPDVGVALPVLIAVGFVAGQSFVVQDAGFDTSSGCRVAGSHFQEQGLDDHRAVGELPAGRRAGSRLRVGQCFEFHLRIVGQREEPLLGGRVGPLRGDHVVGNQPGGGGQRLDRVEQAGGRECLGEVADSSGVGVGGQFVDTAADVVEQVEFALAVLSEADQPHARIDQLRG